MKRGKSLFSMTALLIVFSMLGLSACSQRQNTTAALTGSTDSSSGFYGKVTAIDGSKITLALGTLSQPGGQPNGTIPKDGNQPSGTIPQGRQQPSGTIPQGRQQPGGLSDMLTLTGESKIFTIGDTTVISRMSMQRPGGQGPGGRPGTGTTASGASTDSTVGATLATATLADITVGCILKFTFDENSNLLTSVQILNTGFQPGVTGNMNGEPANYGTAD
jgi:hypothetical protein